MSVRSGSSREYSTQRTEYGQIPPIGDLLVPGHETSMDIRLFREWTTGVIPNLFAVIKECVCEYGSDRRK